MEMLHVLLFVLLKLSSAQAKEEDVIFDSTTFRNLNWDSFIATTDQDGWHEELYKHNKKFTKFYSVCDKNRKGANSWVTTPGVSTNGSEHLWLALKYSIKPCDDDVVPVCQMGVYYQELNRASVIPVPLLTTWKELLILTNNVTVEDSKASLVINEISTVIDINNNKPFISVGFQDTGSCTRLISVRIFTRFCSNTTAAFATFRETFALAEDQVILGDCVQNAELAFQPKSTCTREGDWAQTTGGCKCKEGFVAFEDTACLSTSDVSRIKYTTSLLVLLLLRNAIW